MEGVHTTGRWAGGGKTLKASTWLRRPQGERGEGECVARKALLNALVQCKTVQKIKPLGNWRSRISALAEEVVICEYIFQALKLNSDRL